MFSRKPKTGFTLVELLVVIAIITVLVAMLLPALNKTRQQANLIKCQSNLRQIGIAFETYTLNNGGYLPMGSTPQNVLNNSSGPANPYWTDWTLLLTAAMNGGSGMHGDSQFYVGTAALRQGLFQDSDVPDLSNGSLGNGNVPENYSVHPRICPAWGYGTLDTGTSIPSASVDWYQMSGLQIGGYPQYPLYKLVRIQNPQYTVLAMDAVVDVTTDAANPTATYIDNAIYESGEPPLPTAGGFLVSTATNSWELSQAFNAGPNTDCSNYAAPVGDIRFRHMNNTEGNFLFCDLHVEAKRYHAQYSSELNLSNFLVNPP